MTKKKLKKRGTLYNIHKKVKWKKLKRWEINDNNNIQY